MSETIEARLDGLVTELLAIFTEQATMDNTVFKARFDRAMADFVMQLSEAAIEFWAGTETGLTVVPEGPPPAGA
jgi:hypothetical protein